MSGTLITQFRKLLVTECEIFVSILIRFLDHDKPVWQRALVLEVVHELCAQPELLESFSLHYDMQSKSTKVCVEIFTLLCARHAGPQHLVRSDLTLAFAYGVSDSRRVHTTYIDFIPLVSDYVSITLSFFACIAFFTRVHARALHAQLVTCSPPRICLGALSRKFRSCSSPCAPITAQVFRELVQAVWTLIRGIVNDPSRAELFVVGAPKPTSKFQ